MKFDLSRVIIFTDNMTKMEDFYGTAIGLKVVGREDGWVEFSGGTCDIALHAGRAKPGNRPPKLVFTPTTWLLRGRI